MRAYVRKFLCGFAVLAAVSLVNPPPAYAQTDEGFVYALLQVSAGPNQVHGFAVNPTTGALTAVAGSPFATDGNGGGGAFAELMMYDPVLGRLYVLNDGSDSISAFALNRSTGALTLLPFSPIALPAGGWASLAISPDGTKLVAADSTRVASFVVTTAAVTAAPGSPFPVSGANPYALEFSPDGAFLYAGGNSGTGIAGFAVNSGTGVLTALATVDGAANPIGYAFDTLGRMFVANAVGGQVRAFTSVAGVLTPATGNPFPSGLGQPVSGLVHPAGGYMAADRSGNQVGVYTMLGSGSATTLAPVPGSPFPTGGLFSDTLALNQTGSLLFAGNGNSRNITTFRVNANLSLSSLSLQPADTLGAAGLLTTLAFVPLAPAYSIQEFPLPNAGSNPTGIAAGPDGNIWFTEFGGNRIGRITTGGTITEFTVPTVGSVPDGITAGPDGNLWFTERNGNKIGRITPSGTITEFTVPTPGSSPRGVTAGPDGNIWFTEMLANKIGRITPAGAFTEFTLPAGGSPFAITRGPDGNLWYTLNSGNRIGRITTAGVITEFPVPTASGSLLDITTGPDGALWFTKTVGRMGRITTSGSITEFGGPSSGTLIGTTLGPDANIWYATTTVVGRMTTGGSVAEYTPPSAIGIPGLITTGADGNMWFTQTGSNRIGVVILSNVSFSVVKAGTGTGTVTGTVGNTTRINCGTTCGTLLTQESVLTLTASPSPGSRFVGWSGGGCSGTAPCVLPVNDNTTVTATFSPIPVFMALPSTLNFGVTNFQDTLQHATPAQVLRLLQVAGPAAEWTASANQPWITVSPTAGTGSTNILISINNTDAVLPASGTLAGLVTITPVGATGPTTATINLTVLTPPSATSPVGSFDTPTDGITGVTGSIAVTGWAIDDIGISRLRILRDPVGAEPPGVQLPVGNAVFIAGARPDVAAAFPTKPFNDRAGWGILVLTNFLPNQGNGTFRLYAYADDVEGNTTLLGSKQITCTNATATAPFGAIDTPAQGGVASGAAFLNFGWALTPQPKIIPTDGSTILVFIDSSSIGALTSYNNPRPDIQALFPGYNNTDGAAGFKTIDTTALSNGVHTIAWIATDNLGAAAGIGSRFFTVANGTSGTPAPTDLTAAMAATATTFLPGDLEVVDAMPAAVGRADSLSAISPSARGLSVRRGYADDAEAVVVWPGRTGVRAVKVAPMERIAVDLDAGEGARATYRGYTLLDGELRELPIGSTLNADTGEFLWAPPLAFGGTHALVFVRETEHGSEQLRVDVVIDTVPVRRVPQRRR